jgi:hypothetical protein
MRGFWGVDGNEWHFDCGGGYMDVQLCQSSLNPTFKTTTTKQGQPVSNKHKHYIFYMLRS